MVSKYSDCLMCEDRTVSPNCHETCEKYIKFKTDKLESKKLSLKDKLSSEYLSDYYYNKKHKWIKAHKRGGTRH